MTRIYMKLLVCIISIASLAVGISPLLGRLRPTNPVLDGIHLGCEGQPQPCWYGIRPGKTTMTDALHIISQTNYVKMNKNDYMVTLVYRNATMRCGVEIRSEAGLVDTITIINCLDRQVGDVVKAMRNANHTLPFSMGMLDATMNAEITDSFVDYLPCLGYTPYGQIIGMPLAAPGHEPPPAPAGWHDFLPYGWYVHAGGTLSCDLVDNATKFS